MKRQTSQEIVESLEERLLRADKALRLLIEEYPDEVVRLRGKLEGIHVALGYVREEKKIHGL